MQEIKLKIMPDGEVKIEVRGVKGTQCMKLTEFLENQLGLVVKREKTAEYYAKQPVTVVNKEAEQK